MAKLLRESGVDFKRVDCRVDPIPKTKLKDLIRKMRISPRELLRKKEAAYKKLKLDGPKVTDKQILDAMAAHPELIQRPIVEKGAGAVLARARREGQGSLVGTANS